MATIVKIAGIQMDVQLGAIATNLEQLQTLLRKTTSEGAEVSIFSECALTGDCFRSLEHALKFGESVPGPSVQAMVDLCEELRTCAVFGMLERVASDLFNVAVLTWNEGSNSSEKAVSVPPTARS